MAAIAIHQQGPAHELSRRSLRSHPDDALALEAIENDNDRLEHLTEEIEERYFKGPEAYIAESDKSWDAMHRALSDGTLSSSGGSYPLNHVVLGGTSLYADDDYIMSLKTPAQVRDIAAVLASVDEAEFRRLYDNIDVGDYDGDVSDEDFEYTWGWFAGVRDLYIKAAAEGRFVLLRQINRVEFGQEQTFIASVQSTHQQPNLFQS